MSGSLADALLERSVAVLGSELRVQRISTQLVDGVIGYLARPHGDVVGVAFDSDQAAGVGRAVGEAFERHAYFSSRTRVDIVSARGEPIVDSGPRSVGAHEPAFVVGRSQAGSRTLIPEEFVLPAGATVRPSSRHRSTVGTALAPAAADAERRALEEIVERDVLGSAVAGELMFGRVADSGLGESEVVRAALNAGGRVHVGARETHSGTVIAVCLIELPVPEHCLFAGGSSADSSLASAVHSAAREAVQNLHVEAQHAARPVAAGSAHHRMLWRRARAWTDSDQRERSLYVRQLISAEPWTELPPVHSVSSNEHYVFDLTPPELADIARVIRCVVPGAQLLPTLDTAPASNRDLPHPFF